jgi:hypothetical protein
LVERDDLILFVAKCLSGLAHFVISGGRYLDGGADAAAHQLARLVLVGEHGVHLAVAEQDEFESNILKQYRIFWFQALSSRRFQRGIDRVNLHRPSLPDASSFSSGPLKRRTTSNDARCMATLHQGLTRIHFAAQPEPYLTQKHTLNTP